MTASRPPSASARSAAKPSKPIRLDRQGRHHGRRSARPHRPDHRAFRIRKLVSATRDRTGNVIDGSPEKVTDVTDVWTFARDVSIARSQLEARRHRSRDTEAGSDGAQSGHGSPSRWASRLRRGPRRRAAAPAAATARYPDAQLEPLAWADLDGWAADDHAAAFAAFRDQLPADRARREAPRTMLVRSMRRCIGVCRKRAAPVPALDADKARAFFEENFRPLAHRQARRRRRASSPAITSRSSTARACRRPEFTVPLYRRPRESRLFGPKPQPTPASFPNKGVKVGRLIGQPQARAVLRSRSPSRTARSTAAIWKSAG